MSAPAPSTIVVLTASTRGYGAWGQGATLTAALRNARANGGAPSKRGYTALTFGPGSTFEGVDEFGRVHWTGNEPEAREVAA